jgi:hypothetical protein
MDFNQKIYTLIEYNIVYVHLFSFKRNWNFIIKSFNVWKKKKKNNRARYSQDYI